MIRSVFYVYVLFDWLGLPRYVGKGSGDRWFDHEMKTDDHNPLKNSFIEQTWLVLGEIPKIKLREHLTEAEAIATEIALIAAIGRYPEGPLFNQTNGGEGVDSAGKKAWWASFSPEERRAMMRTWIPVELNREAGRRSHARNLAPLTQEQREAAGRKGYANGLANQTREQRRDLGLQNLSKLQASRTPAMRVEQARSIVANMSAAQLSERARRAAAGKTPEQRRDAARKGALARHAKRVAELERSV
jgi:hypothetical protein